MKNKITNEEHMIYDSDIDTIDKTIDRLFLFQLNRKDFEIVKKELKNIYLNEDILLKFRNLIKRTKENTEEEKEYIIKTFEKYLETINDIQIGEEYFKNRKEIGKLYGKYNVSDELHLSLYIRLFEFFIPYIIKTNSYFSDRGSSAITSFIKIILFDYRLISKFKNEGNNLEIVKNINKIMSSIMEIDKTKSLLDSIENTILHTDNVASATEQLSTSIINITDNIQTVASNTNVMVEDISIGQVEIEKALNGVFDLNNDFKNTKENINELVNKMKSISKIISFIKNISEQTTLLAINASIEASRAGINGKGFSVIANEIRTLSEETTKSVEEITNVIKDVEDESSVVEKNAHFLSEELEEKGDKAKNSILTLENIINQIKDIGQFTNDIAEIANEQSISTKKIVDYLSDVIKNSEKVKKEAKETGNSIYSVSKEIDQLRNQTINLIPDLRHKHFLDIIKTEQQTQQWWIYNSLLKFHPIQKEKRLSSTQSSFWKWYSKAKQNSKISVLAPFKELEQKHLELFHLEEKIKYLILKEEFTEAHELLSELQSKTKEISKIIEILDKDI